MTSLADRIMAAPSSDMVIRYTTIRQQIDGAMFFRIDDAVRDVAVQIKDSPASRILEAIRFARLPFRTTWLEWNARNIPGDLPAEEGTFVPDKTGVLFECIDATHQRGFATWVYGKGKTVAVLPVGAAFDFTGTGGRVPNFMRDFHDMESPDVDFYDAAYEERGALLNDERIVKNWGTAKREDWSAYMKSRGPVMARAAVPMVKEMAKRLPVQEMQKAMTTWLRDLEGEPQLLEAVLTVLNSKNLVKIEEGADNTKLNKARRRLNRPPMVSFSHVNINLDRIAKGSSVGGSSAADIRAHIVRGHFKVRKTGIFWWSPFMRGSPESGFVVRTGYGVSAREARL